MPTPESGVARHTLPDLGRGLFVLTAHHEGKRSGLIARSVQVCADDPPLLAVAVRTGHGIDPLIRDSHAFAVCRVSPTERLLLRKLAEPSRGRDSDPFDCVPVDRLVTGAPVLARTTLAVDCEVVRHFDLEADHELFIGLVRAFRQGDAPPTIIESALPRARP
jgi:flavin reductase (DIM6/NTAB) family NADH-FMN oxidoreductase RutF